MDAFLPSNTTYPTRDSRLVSNNSTTNSLPHNFDLLEGLEFLGNDDDILIRSTAPIVLLDLEVMTDCND
jgi:hypothetical protein